MRIRSWRRGTVVAMVLALLVVPAAVLAIDRFTDVPTDAFYHDAVNEIAEAKVTIGCTIDRTQYCPEAPTTRGEMATFLARGMGRVAFSGVGTSVPVTGTSQAGATEINSVTIETGGAEPGGTAYVKLDATWAADIQEGTTPEVTVALVDGAGQVSGTYTATVDDNGAITWVVPVDTATSHTFRLVAWTTLPETGPAVRGEISALHVPFSTEQPPG